MSLIDYGMCSKCGKEYYRSFGHPDWYNPWVLSMLEFVPIRSDISEKDKKDFEYMLKMSDWYFGNYGLCINCMSNPPE